MATSTTLDAPSTRTSGTASPAPAPAKPQLPTFADSVTKDLVAGFLVFLIALPLCLGIAKASGFPPIAGVVTAVIGGLISGLFSNSQLTIKGPAAGMIAIVSGAMLDFGFTQGVSASADLQAYRFVLAVGVASGVIQIVLGLARAGVLGDFFPPAPVHGLLASIGLIIIAKQTHPMFGVPSPKDGPISCFAQIPHTLANADLKVASIGLLSLAILFYYPMLKKRVKALDKVPAQLIVVILGIVMGRALHLGDAHLIALPAQITDAIVFPDFSRVFDSTSIKWITMFAVVGTLESMLSAKAIDFLDPWKRKTGMNRDVLGVGVANTAAAAVGGLPMISEILRSSANIAYGARTRLSNVFHGIFLAAALILLTPLVRLIPNAVLGALLVFAGFRLASPKQFLHMWHTGKDQFLVFCLTIGFIIPQGHLLDGIAVGVAAELALNFLRGASPTALFKPRLAVAQTGASTQIAVEKSLTFTNWVSFRRSVEKLGDVDNLTVDCSRANFLDYSARERLQQLRREWADAGRKLTVLEPATAV
jgi:MFS superfamily sulfate permease-like transporter